MNQIECILCNQDIIDKVYMTCSIKHAFCFSCILKNVEVTNQLKPCSLCRGGEKFIMIEKIIETQGPVNFYTLDYFKKSLPILQKILNDSNSPNTCLISEQLLITYVNNKKQLDIAHKLIMQDYKLPDLIPLIKWNEVRTIDEQGMDFFGNLINEFTRTQGMQGSPVFSGGFPFNLMRTSNQ